MSSEGQTQGRWPVILRFRDLPRGFTDREFFEFCQLNEDLRIERTSEGDMEIMPLAGATTSMISSSLTAFFGVWSETDGTGIGFAASTGFTLPNRAVRSPDLAWVRRDRWQALTPQEQDEFPPLCPDFVVELRSPSDTLRTLQAKMEEYLANGASLGWLIDPIEKKVHVYRPATEACCLDHPATVSGDPVLPGFVLELHRLWG